MAVGVALAAAGGALLLAAASVYVLLGGLEDPQRAQARAIFRDPSLSRPRGTGVDAQGRIIAYRDTAAGDLGATLALVNPVGNTIPGPYDQAELRAIFIAAGYTPEQADRILRGETP